MSILTNFPCQKTWQLPSTSTIATVIITQPVGWYSFYRPTEGRRHCSKGAQSVPKTVYHSSRRDKNNCPRCDSNLDPLTPQSNALTTRLLRPAMVPYWVRWSWQSVCNISFGIAGESLLTALCKKAVYKDTLSITSTLFIGVNRWSVLL